MANGIEQLISALDAVQQHCEALPDDTAPQKQQAIAAIAAITEARTALAATTADPADIERKITALIHILQRDYDNHFDDITLMQVALTIYQNHPKIDISTPSKLNSLTNLIQHWGASYPNNAATPLFKQIDAFFKQLSDDDKRTVYNVSVINSVQLGEIDNAIKDYFTPDRISTIATRLNLDLRKKYNLSNLILAAELRTFQFTSSQKDLYTDVKTLVIGYASATEKFASLKRLGSLIQADTKRNEINTNVDSAINQYFTPLCILTIAKLLNLTLQKGRYDLPNLILAAELKTFQFTPFQENLYAAVKTLVTGGASTTEKLATHIKQLDDLIRNDTTRINEIKTSDELSGVDMSASYEKRQVVITALKTHADNAKQTITSTAATADSAHQTVSPATPQATPESVKALDKSDEILRRINNNNVFVFGRFAGDAVSYVWNHYIAPPFKKLANFLFGSNRPTLKTTAADETGKEIAQPTTLMREVSTLEAQEKIEIISQQWSSLSFITNDILGKVQESGRTWQYLKHNLVNLNILIDDFKQMDKELRQIPVNSTNANTLAALIQTNTNTYQKFEIDVFKLAKKYYEFEEVQINGETTPQTKAYVMGTRAINAIRKTDPKKQHIILKEAGAVFNALVQDISSIGNQKLNAQAIGRIAKILELLKEVSDILKDRNQPIYEGFKALSDQIDETISKTYQQLIKAANANNIAPAIIEELKTGQSHTPIVVPVITSIAATTRLVFPEPITTQSTTTATTTPVTTVTAPVPVTPLRPMTEEEKQEEELQRKTNAILALSEEEQEAILALSEKKEEEEAYTYVKLQSSKRESAHSAHAAAQAQAVSATTIQRKPQQEPAPTEATATPAEILRSKGKELQKLVSEPQFLNEVQTLFTQTLPFISKATPENGKNISVQLNVIVTLINQSITKQYALKDQLLPLRQAFETARDFLDAWPSKIEKFNLKNKKLLENPEATPTIQALAAVIKQKLSEASLTSPQLPSEAPPTLAIAAAAASPPSTDTHLIQGPPVTFSKNAPTTPPVVPIAPSSAITAGGDQAKGSDTTPAHKK